MYVRCNVESCTHWSEDGGDFTYEGGCTLEQIRISDETKTAAGWFPQCEDYEEKETGQ